MSDDNEKPLKIELDIDPEELRQERARAPAAQSLPPVPTTRSPQRAYTPPPVNDGSKRKPIIVGVALALLFALTIYFFYWDDWFPPDPADRVAKVTEAPDGALEYDGKLYPSKWEKDEEIGGIVSQVEPGYIKLFPFLTHEVVLVTGDYADPEKVTISTDKVREIVNISGAPLKGTIQLVNILPADPTALEELEKLTPGRRATLRGDSLIGALVTPEKASLQMRGATKVFRLRSVSLEEANAEKQ